MGTCEKGSVSEKVSNKKNHLFSFKNSLTCFNSINLIVRF